MAEEREAGGFEAGARFGCEGVGDESGVADGFGGAPGGAVEAWSRRCGCRRWRSG